MKRYGAYSVIVIVALLSGCAQLRTLGTTSASADKLPVHIENRFYPDIDRAPVPPERKKIILDVKNTSGCSLDLSAIFTELFGRDYEVVKDHEHAFYIVQADVMAVGQISREEVTGWLKQGWGSKVPNVMFAEALQPGEIPRELAYAIVTDIQVKERIRHAVRNRPAETHERPVPIVDMHRETADGQWEIRRTRMTSQLATPPPELEGRSIDEIVRGMTDGVVRGMAGVL